MGMQNIDWEEECVKRGNELRTLRKELKDWEENVEYLLNSYAGSVRIVPGGVQEVLMESMCVTFIKLREEVKKHGK
jgi:hypothetical protein